MACDEIPADPTCDTSLVEDGVALDVWVEVARQVMREAIGRRYGVCSYVWRPCACRACRRSLACSTTLPFVWVPPPIESVTAVVIEGVTLDPAAYTVQQDSVLRTDDEPWPGFQDLTVAPTEANAWGITYRRGRPWPSGTAEMVGRYACELAKSSCGADCEIPQRVRTLTRQGVTYEFAPTEYLDRNRTGVTLIDSWLAAVNPRGQRRRARVYRADQFRSPHGVLQPVPVV